MKSRFSLALVTFFAVLVVHVVIAFIFELPGHFGKYDVAAAQYLAGELPAHRIVDFSPLYFELNVLLQRLVPNPVAVLGFLQMVLMAAAAGFFAAQLERRFSRVLAIGTVAAFALDRHVVIYERILEPEACLLFAVLGWFCFLERYLETRRAGTILAAGLFAAAALATRPTFLPLVFVIPFYLWLADAEHRSHWWRRCLLFVAPVAVVLALLAVRTAVHTGDAGTPVMNPGTVFYEGNNPLSNGTSAMYPPLVRALQGGADPTKPDIAHEYYRVVARVATGEDLSIPEVNAYWSGLALGYIKSEPMRFLSLTKDKLLFAFHAFRWHDVFTAWRYETTLLVPAIPFAIVSALALLGILFEARTWHRSLMFYLLIGAQLGVMILFYVSARQRLVMLPALFYFAAVAVETLRERRSVLYVALAALLALCLALPTDEMTDERYSNVSHDLAEMRFAELRAATSDAPLAAHVDLALEAVAAAPWIEWVPAEFPQEEKSFDEALAEHLVAHPRSDVSGEFDRAVVFLRAGRLDEAEALFAGLVADGRRVYRGSQQPSEPLFYLARIAARRGRRDRAVEILEEALEASPGNAFVLADLVALTDEVRYQDALDLVVSPLDSQYLVGQALLEHGRAASAASAFAFVVRRLPEFRAGRLHLAAAFYASGRLDEAAQVYIEAVRSQPDPLLLSAASSDLFRRWAALHPEDPQVRLIAARVLREHGHFNEALALLEGNVLSPDLAAQAARERRLVERALAALASADRVGDGP